MQTSAWAIGIAIHSKRFWRASLALAMAAGIVSACTAGVAHNVAVVLPTPHLNSAMGTAKQFGNLFFYTDRNIPDTSFAYNALISGKTAEAMDILSKIEASNLPSIQQAYWQNDVAVCFILEGRYKEADELLVQAGMIADEEAIRHNHRVGVYLHESFLLSRKKTPPSLAPQNKQASPETAPSPAKETPGGVIKGGANK